MLQQCAIETFIIKSKTIMNTAIAPQQSCYNNFYTDVTSVTTIVSPMCYNNCVTTIVTLMCNKSIVLQQLLHQCALEYWVTIIVTLRCFRVLNNNRVTTIVTPMCLNNRVTTMCNVLQQLLQQLLHRLLQQLLGHRCAGTRRPLPT